MHDLHLDNVARVTRRRLFGSAGMGIGSVALAALLRRDARGGSATPPAPRGVPGLPDLPHHEPKAKRVVMLWQGGGPSHVDLFDPKPELIARGGQDIPETVRGQTRLSTMSSGYAKWPIVSPIKPFAKYGRCGIEMSELVPRLGSLADDLCVVRSMHTDAINHDPGMSFLQSGSQLPGRPALGSWLSYGLGSVNLDLPSFVVLVSRGAGRPQESPVYDRFWASGFLPGEHQGKITGIAGVAAWIIPAQAQRLFGIVVERTGSFDYGLALAGLLPLLALFPLWLLWTRGEAKRAS